MDGQTIIASVIVAIAAGWIIRRMVQTIRKGLAGKAESCAGCPKNAAENHSPPVVGLEMKRLPTSDANGRK